MSLARLNDDLPPMAVSAFGIKPKHDSLNDDDSSNKGDFTSYGLDNLSKFIPTEMLAPYVAFLAYAIEHESPSKEFVYWSFVVATPFLTIFFQFVKSAKKNSAWPALIAVFWRAVAATIAFAVWGISPPGSAFQAEIGGPIVAGFAAMVVSPLLQGADDIALRMMRIKRVSK
jgi:hypothetical protein